MKIEIGCCGAYCRTCKVYNEKICKGCKLGYEECRRDINKSKCRIKLCCFKDKGFDTCIDCSEFAKCEIINEFYNKNGFKYKKYKEALEYIKENGYNEFIKKADSWKGAYGKLKD